MSDRKIIVLILAAGNSNRMNSDLSKVLHNFSGKPLIQYVLDAAKSINPYIIYLIHNKNNEKLLKNLLSYSKLYWILQKNNLGTANAVNMVCPYFKDKEEVLILYGDVPLISQKTLKKLIKFKKNNDLVIITKYLKKNNDYGRILRKNSKVVKIIESKNATKEQLSISEVYTGILIANSADLKRWIPNVKRDHINNEYLLTDIIHFAYQENKKIAVIHPQFIEETDGINNQYELKKLEKIYQKKRIKKLLIDGVILNDPDHFYLKGEMIYGKNLEIDTNVKLNGKVILGKNVTISSGCIISNSTIGDNCQIKPFSIIEDTIVSSFCIIGPFAHLHSNNIINSNSYIGNFVEMKEVTFGDNSKTKHLSYVGNASIGKNVNIGAGTITCNFDGKNKHPTTIGNNVFIGSNTEIIAPLVIEDNAIIAAGTTVKKNVKEKELVYNKKKQIHISNWKNIKKS
ncbi:bifunctional UDP-N-acetylglucosamine diphosphorylase/glucosamine-1-phosphate N-acetyltransferase GlmU [Candidatus Tachikawaea gelatinosa]|uniref:Bifunctional protein GlmU n=1 Tax=Candidatus Tachikawaea gelatinosa TaxID=1410383 RepID=A0A090AIN1_9ENTR|nr:bifunctional UDP-N-acetylglucosamine diphosphorylase/glucosamine-1-phosphate N-acetyltransferase GlmU [Candidatus Tachikawaea gelatinosa]BAP58273.1 bifunctional N-acetylglucosamine-1-phosphate uridyltransferase/glucosamine-1-phosphate acetyltransferase [Candidatus Tachikawaea gelatinosa]